MNDILVETNYGGSGTSGSPNIYYSTATAMHQQWTTDSNPPAGNGSVNANRPNITFVGITQTTPPLATTPIAPMNNATLVNTSVALNWNIVNGAEGYKVYLGTNSTPPFVADVGNASTYSPAGLQPGTTYYWQIVPYNVYGEATGCPVWSFTTAPAGMVTIGTGNSNQYLPVYPYYGYTYSQSIYLQSEINMQDQRIEKIAFYWNGAGAGTNTSDWVVYMGHTDNNTFASTSDWLPLSELTQVYAGNLGITATVGWKEIVLTNPFVYNNTQNLVIAVDENTPSYDGSSQFFFSTLTSGQNRSIRYYNDTTNPDPASPPIGTLVAAHPNIMIQFGELPLHPIFTYLPTSIDFGSVMNASPSLPQNVTVSNNGAGLINLAAGDISIFGPNANEFSFNTANLPAALGPGQNVAIPVSVTPTSVGNISATLRMVYDGVNYDVALSANGLPAGLVMIGDGTATGTYLPINTLYGYSYSQTIYLQSEINTQDQRIEKIAYYWDAAGTGISNDQWTIYMGHADNVGFTSTTSWIPFSDLTQVYSGTVSFPATAGWMEIQLTQPFVYNNAQNLVIATLESSPSYTYGGSFLNTVAANRSIRYQSDSVLPNPASPPTGILQGHYPNIMMFFGDLPIEPVLTYTPNSINFGSIMNATTSAPQNVTVMNTGVGELNLSLADVSIIGINANEFSFGTENLPMALSPGQSATIPITVTAATEGAISATLRMNYAGEYYDVALSATGLPAGLIIIGDGVVATRYPLGSYFGYERSASLYTAAEIGGGNNRISALGWYATQAAGDNVPTKIYLKGHPSTTVAPATWANFIQGAALVFDATVNGVQQNDWNTFTLNNTFDLDSGDNLLVLVERNYGGGGGSAGNVAPAIRGTTLVNMHQMIQADNSPPTGTTSSQASRPNIMIFATSYDISNPPNPAVLVSPDDGTNMVLQTPTLVWGSGGGAPSGYKLYLGTNNPPGFVQDLGDVTSYTPDTALAGETTYYWQIVPYNNNGDATGCPVWSFTTLPDGLVIIGDGTLTQRQPFGTVWGYERSAALYMENEIDNYGFITDLHWYCQNTTTTNVPYKIYLGSTDATAFTNATWASFSEDLSLVKEGTQVFDVIGWHSFVLDNPYLYEGGNLIIAVETFYGGSGGGSGHTFLYTTSASNSHQIWYGDGTPPAGNGTLNASRPNIMMFISDPPQGPPAPPIMVDPINNATGLPVTGFNLTWLADLNNGGMPAYYAVYLSHGEDTIFDEYYFETQNTFFNPVAEGSMEFDYLETWYWLVHAFNNDGDELAERVFSFTTGADPRVDLPYYEDFGTTGQFPLNWSQTISGDVSSYRWSMSNSNDAGGEPYEMICTWLLASGISRLITPPLNTAGIGSIKVSFKHYLNDYATGCTGKVQYSHNLIDWYDTGFEFDSGTEIPPTEENINISGLNASTTYIAWVMDGNHYNYNYWYVDDVAIFESSDLDAPEFTITLLEDSMILDWVPVDGAEWYALYESSDPYGEFTLVDVIPAIMDYVQIYLDDEDIPDIVFFRLTAGYGEPPYNIDITSPLRLRKHQDKTLKKK